MKIALINENSQAAKTSLSATLSKALLNLWDMKF